MFFPVCALPSPASAESCLSLFGWFTGTTAQSDFSCTFASAVRFMAFADRSWFVDQDVQEIPRFSCMLFLSVRGFSDYAGPTNHSRFAWLSCCLRPIGTESTSCSIRFSKLNSPAHRYLCLRFKRYLATPPARLEAKMDSLFLSCRALSPPTTRRFIPALSDKRGGLNGSMQHLPKVLSYGPSTLISFAGVNSNKTKPLFRF